MGDAATPHKEHILCIMPLDDAAPILDGIRRRHPNVEFTFIRQTLLPDVPWAMNKVDVPDGKSPNAGL
jgi:hypothetical protein